MTRANNQYLTGIENLLRDGDYCTASGAQWAKYRSDANIDGWVLLTKGRFAEAATLLAPQPVTPYSYPWNRYPLALALERLGKPEEAIVRLEEENLPHNCINLGFTWPLCRVKLAGLYRKVGRLDDAKRVDDQLRHYLSEADPDFPILKQLK